MYTTEAGQHLVIAGLAPGGPAERAGARVGDMIVDVGGAKPNSLADLWRRIWAAGPVGSVVLLTVARNGKQSELRITSADRSDFLKKPHLH
jgi:S1-C subfamily serine protease